MTKSSAAHQLQIHPLVWTKLTEIDPAQDIVEDIGALPASLISTDELLQKPEPGSCPITLAREKQKRTLTPAPPHFAHPFLPKRNPESSDDVPKGFTCRWCSRCYTSQIYLHKHSRRCHSKEYKKVTVPGEIKHQDLISGSLNCYGQMQEEVHSCSQCGKSFSEPDNLLRHQHVHTRKKIHHCSECEKSFTNKNDFQTHHCFHTGEKPYDCTECGKSFTTKSNLQKHQRIHTGEKPYHCLQCGKNFYQGNHLQEHLRIHSGEKPHRCPECGKCFTKKYGLQMHHRVHTGEKPYHCSWCEKRFTNKGDLQRHQRVHTGEKLHCCSHCGNGFTRKSNLERHQCIHTGEKP